MNPTLQGLLMFGAVVALNFGGMIAAASLLGPKRRNPVKDEPFECGSLPLGPAGGRLHIRFYLIGILFLIFDVEAVFLIPWAVVYKSDLGWYGFWSMAIFFTILVFGLIYEWRRGGMEWD